MTDYITEMMKTAEISKTDITNGVDDYTYSYWLANGYPPFTAEKQLELIKLIMKIEHFTLVDKEVPVTSMKNKNIGMWCKDATGYSSDFSQALALLITELMRAGELDKEKVKEVLKG